MMFGDEGASNMGSYSVKPALFNDNSVSLLCSVFFFLWCYVPVLPIPATRWGPFIGRRANKTSFVYDIVDTTFIISYCYYGWFTRNEYGYGTITWCVLDMATPSTAVMLPLVLYWRRLVAFTTFSFGCYDSVLVLQHLQWSSNQECLSLLNTMFLCINLVASLPFWCFVHMLRFVAVWFGSSRIW
jgi:hypothetical protein